MNAPAPVHIAPGMAVREPAPGPDPAPRRAGLHLGAVGLTYTTRQGELVALSDVSFDISPGEFVSVLGPSGCGKSTLLKLVSGLLAPSSGRIDLAGAEVRGPRRDVGVVFQQPTLLPWKTVLDNVLMPIRAMRFDVAQYRPRAVELLDLVGLAGFERNYPSELSGGMQQRVAVARGLIHDPAMLLMDEPFAALDAMTREHLMVELQRIWEQTRKSVLFITHSLPEAAFLSDRVLIMSRRPGRVVREVKVDLPRPRTEATLATDAFNRLTASLRDTFRTPEVAGDAGSKQ